MPDPTIVLDKYYVGISAVVGIPMQAAVVGLAAYLRSSTLTSTSLNSLFFGTAWTVIATTLVTWLCGFTQSFVPRNIVGSVAVLIYATHLYIFVLVRRSKLRKIRLAHSGLAKDPAPFPSSSWLPRSALIWVPSLVLLPWVILLPLSIGNSPRVVYPGEGGTHLNHYSHPSDIIGTILLGLGFILELVALYSQVKLDYATAAVGEHNDAAPLALQPSSASSAGVEGGVVSGKSVARAGLARYLPSPPHSLLPLSLSLLALGLWVLFATPAFYSPYFTHRSRFSSGVEKEGAVALVASVVAPVAVMVGSAVWAVSRKRGEVKRV
ncbi:hypothetical protein JCM8097_002321 [Rhodosporidiobolus ruineniae]